MQSAIQQRIDKSRRKFSKSLVEVVALLAASRATSAATGELVTGASTNHHTNRLTGYPFRLTDGNQMAAWSCVPGEEIHFGLSSDKPQTLALKLMTPLGEAAYDFAAVKVPRQTLSGESPWENGAAFSSVLRWRVPRDMASGVYFLNGLPDIFVVVKETSATKTAMAGPHIPTAVVVPTNTISAYSSTEGRSFYSKRMAPILSFLRPFNASAEAAWRRLARFVSSESIFGSARFLTDFDLETTDALASTRLLIIAGHSEYWSRSARRTVDEFIEAGNHVIVAGGNVMWWQVRYSEDGNQLICYKDAREDPIKDRSLATINWPSPLLRYPTIGTIGGDFVHGGYGRRLEGRRISSAGFRVADAQHPLLSGLGLSDCEILDLGGVSEMDGAPIVGFDVLGRPIPDLDAVAAHQLEILAWDWGRHIEQTTVGTAHVYQKSKQSGAVLHLGAIESCEGTATGCTAMRSVCRTFAQRIVEGRSVFSGQAPMEVATMAATPFAGQPPQLHGRCG